MALFHKAVRSFSTNSEIAYEEPACSSGQTHPGLRTLKAAWGSVAMSPAAPGGMFCKALLSYSGLLPPVWAQRDTEPKDQGCDPQITAVKDHPNKTTPNWMST